MSLVKNIYMKDFMIFKVLLILVKTKRTNAQTIAKELEISQRSVYRYLDYLTLLGVPLVTYPGRSGGIELIGSFYIDSLFLTKKERDILKNFIKKTKCDKNVRNVIEKII